MKRYIILIALIFCCQHYHVNGLKDEELDFEDMDESGRFAYLTISDSGITTAFNATSLQYLVVMAVALIVVTLVILPIMNFGLVNVFERSDYAHSDSLTQYFNSAYDDSTYSSYRKK